ncbi:MAG: phenylalanine--tRNA ligase subunit alpha [Candidatus Helarchaeota archaeon]
MVKYLGKISSVKTNRVKEMMTISRSIAVSKNELSILKALQKLGGKATPEDIARQAKLERNQVISSRSWLVTKNLISVEEERKTEYTLTKDGMVFADKSLPERQLIESLSKVKVESLKNLKSKVKPEQFFNIGIKWAKTNKWIEFTKLKDEKAIKLNAKGLSALKTPSLSDQILKSIAKAPNSMMTLEDLKQAHANLSDELLAQLLKRKLIESKERIKITFVLNSKIKLEDLITDQITRLSRDDISSGAWKTRAIKPYDVAIRAPILYPGRKHPYLEILDEVREILIGMGFQEEKGPLVECEFWDFDALFQAQDHPAREIHDTYKLKFPQDANLKIDQYKKNVMKTHLNGWKTGSQGWGVFDETFATSRRLILRSQTTAVSVRTINKYRDPPIRMFCIDKVFRPDVLDAKHALEFHQVEGIVLDEGLTLRNLFGVLSQFARELGFKEVKFKPGYFPFTEPSVEAFVKHEKLGWIEILGSGLFRPEVLIPFGIDYPRVQCLAWGIGIGRLAMIRLGLDDIRELHSQNLEYLRTAGMVRKTRAKS